MSPAADGTDRTEHDPDAASRKPGIERSRRASPARHSSRRWTSGVPWFWPTDEEASGRSHARDFLNRPEARFSDPWLPTLFFHWELSLDVHAQRSG